MDSNFFKTLRTWVFGIVIVGAIVVLGICATLISPLLTTGIHDFLIFSLVVTVFTILVLLLLGQRSQPRVDAVILFILAALWLTMGAYTQDIIGHQLCYGLKGQTMPTRNNSTMSAESYCRQMKTVLAFSWANFVFLTLWFIRFLSLVTDIHARGNRDIWGGSMSDVTLPPENHRPVDHRYADREKQGRYTRSPSIGRERYTPRETYAYPNSNRPAYPQVVHQQPGHSVVVQNGQAIQVPGSVVSL